MASLVHCIPIKSGALKLTYIWKSYSNKIAFQSKAYHLQTGFSPSMYNKSNRICLSNYTEITCLITVFISAVVKDT